jgi:hypothetical protein
MTKRFLAYFVFLALLRCASSGWAVTTKAQPPVAGADNDRSLHVIAAVQGQVDVKRKGRSKYEPVRIGTSLRRGDLLRVEASSRATVVCADLTKRDVTSGFSGVPCPASRQTTLKLPTGLIKPLRSYESLSFPIIVSPRRTKLLDPHPRLRWTPVAGATTYKVIVRGPNLEWMAVSSKTEIVYPENAPDLKAGNDYRLIVEANGRSSREESIPGLGFTVLPGGEAKEVRREAQKIREMGLPDAPTRLLIAHLYASFDLNAEAIEELEKLPKTLSEPSPVRLLGDLYLAVGLNRRAEERYLYAVDLSEKANDEEGQASAHFALGRIYQEALGNKSAANMHLTAALQSYKKLGDQQKAEDIEERLEKLK